MKIYLEKIAFPEYTFFSFYAILIGAAAGLAAVFFHLSIEFFNNVFFEKTKEGLYFLGTAAVILLPAIGMFIQYLMIRTAPDIAKKRGVLEIIKSVAFTGGYIPLRTTLFHFLAPVISIGSGGTVGPEGPAAQIGGGVASKLATIFKVSDQRRRIFTAAGSGAAIAAIFNTPLGGVFFALEIILLNDFQTPTFSALILASVTASAISRIFLGNESVFTFDIPHIGEYQYFYLFILLGLFCGVLSVLFLKYDDYTANQFKKGFLKKIPQWVTMVSVGLLVGVSGYFYKDIFGVGYSGINQILSNSSTWQVVAVLLVLKFILVPLTLNSGGFGGTFAPSLFMGACAGYLFSFGVQKFLGIPADPTTYILVGMGASLAGINSIPITAILMLFEMTREYSFILPLMLSVIVSSTMVQIVNKGSYHIKKLEKQGFRLTGGKEASILKSISVEEVMQINPVLVHQNASLEKVVAKLMEAEHHIIYTIDDEDNLTGAISETQIRPLIMEFETLRESIIASDIASNRITTVYVNHDLDHVLKILTRLDIDEVPVVSIENDKQIIGIVSRHDILSSYNKESLKSDLADGLSREINTLRETKISRIADGYAIIECKPSNLFVGKTLAQLKLRNTYGLEVLMIKKSKELFNETEKESKIIMPVHNYKIEESDILVLFGTEEKIAKTSEW
ncbi:MAG: chloride channel protein [Ignavibacteriales bacterium]|nr:chloride channel protein [Ignavibacteriales bacterium]